MLTGRLRAYARRSDRGPNTPQTATKKVAEIEQTKVWKPYKLPLQQRCNMLTQNLGHLLAVGPSVPVW